MSLAWMYMGHRRWLMPGLLGKGGGLLSGVTSKRGEFL
ncbi:rCG63719 [Rattus norvegicus]|uniref:RCG63719 n=1 Tax=Rattus norvegicus TaxID=10116 RepID=A6I873_RAT|nr:rCG63719 [Rattus norvegicus]